MRTILVQGNFEPSRTDGAGPQAAGQFTTPAKLLQPAPHVVQAVRAIAVARRAELQAAAIVADGQDQLSLLNGNGEPEILGAGMLDDISQRFFEREEKVVPLFRVQGCHREIFRHIEVAAHRRRL